MTSSSGTTCSKYGLLAIAFENPRRKSIQCRFSSLPSFACLAVSRKEIAGKYVALLVVMASIVLVLQVAST